MNKLGKRAMSTKILSGILVTIVLVVVLVNFVSGTVGQVTTAGSALNTTLGGTGIAPLFAGNNSILVLVLLAGVLLASIFGFMYYVKHK